MPAIAAEKAPYTVIRIDNIFELRHYAPQALAEFIVEGNLQDTGSQAFRAVFYYISGDNVSRGQDCSDGTCFTGAGGEKRSMAEPVREL